MSKKKIVLFTIGLCLLIVLISLIQTNNISWLDEPLYHAIISVKSNTMTAIMKTITNCASTSTIIILCLISLFSLTKKYKGSLYLVINVILSTILNLVIKNIIVRARPGHLRLINETGYSFPSGHSMAAVSFYGFIIFLLINSNLTRQTKWIISTLLTLIVIAVGISRIYLGVHYPSDVIGGYLTSICLLIVTTYLVEKYRRREI